MGVCHLPTFIETRITALCALPLLVFAQIAPPDTDSDSFRARVREGQSVDAVLTLSASNVVVLFAHVHQWCEVETTHDERLVTNPKSGASANFATLARNI